MSSHAVAEIDPPDLTNISRALVPLALTPLDKIMSLAQQGVSPELIDKMMALQDRWEKNQARKAYDNAIAAAKAEIPTIAKNRQVAFDTTKGRTEYKHEDLGEIARTVDPILSKHGLSYRWRMTSNLNEPIVVTCIVSHRDGYSEENTLQAGRDDSGSKNAIQAMGSTITYLQRYTLKGALGLAASNDDDGKDAGPAAATITDEQAKQITLLLAETASDVDRFLKWAKAPNISDIPASQFDACIALLDTKKKRAAP